MTIARVVVSGIPYSVDRPFDYRIPDSLLPRIVPGIRVIVPFGRGNSRREGVVLALENASDNRELKPVDSVLESDTIITPEQIKLAIWMRERFFCTAFEAFRAMLPAGLWFKDGVPKATEKIRQFAFLTVSGEEALAASEKKKLRAPRQADLLYLLSQIGEAAVSELLFYSGADYGAVKALRKQGYLDIENRRVFRRPNIRIQEAKPIIFNEEQKHAFKGLLSLLETDNAAAALLYGVTGSGKTSIYIRLIEQVLYRNQSAILLVPEIALTPQLVGIFTSYFGNNVAVLHSSLGIGERYDEWLRVKSGHAHVVIGTRSAVFAPVNNLGLIIMDEEQEGSYKSESSPRYHARDIAKYRCVANNALLLMGSATPAIESMYLAKAGTYHLFELKKRYNQNGLPGVIPADMRRELKNGNTGDLSEILLAELEENLRKGQQTILYLNRRGAHSAVICSGCGYSFSCPRCSVSLTSHSANRRLMCHYCGYSQPAPNVCPECGSTLKYLGSGTQKVEEELKHRFPDIEVVRMDADTVSLAGAHEQLLERFRKERIPVLLGTQMIAKGLDIENVTLVGVINADSGLYITDFRAREHTFNMITQVVGRAGRGSLLGRAVIQTMSPDNDVITLASVQDYDGFYESEIKLRRAMQVPPFCSRYTLTCSGSNEAAVLRTATSCVIKLKGLFHSEGDRILGPAPAPITRVNNRFHYRVTVSCKGTKENRNKIGFTVRSVSGEKSARGVLIFADTEV